MPYACPDTGNLFGVWLLHLRYRRVVSDPCHQFVHLLVKSVEPTFHHSSPTLASEHRAFYSSQPSQHLQQNAQPLTWPGIQRSVGMTLKIEGLIEHYDIGRLQFIMRAASYLKNANVDSFLNLTNSHYQQSYHKRLNLNLPIIRVHIAHSLEPGC
jgi:hypothetical protein